MKIKNGMLKGKVLNAVADKAKIVGDYMVLSTHTVGDVDWDVQVAFDHRDMTTLVTKMIFSPVLLFLITGFGTRNEPRLPEELSI